MSGRRGSNPRPAAWKAAALPTELLPHSLNPNHQIPKSKIGIWCFGLWNLPATAGRGGNRIRTYEVIRQQIYSLSQLAALVFPHLSKFHRTSLFSRLPRELLKNRSAKLYGFPLFQNLNADFHRIRGSKGTT